MSNSYLSVEAHGSPDDVLAELIGHDFGKPRYCEDVASGAPRNAYRAARMAPALLEYAKLMGAANGEPLLTSIGDLVSDLRHLVDMLVVEAPASAYDEDSVSWWTILDAATRRYEEEVAGE
ncbi:MAG: hypothetical protein ABIQ39_15645 [Ilumatobacteraceae bacterium]